MSNWLKATDHGAIFFLGHAHPLPKYELSSRPERSEVEGPAVLSTSHRMHLEAPALTFVIPSEAEGSAVLQARPGNVFRQSGATCGSRLGSLIPSLGLVCRLCHHPTLDLLLLFPYSHVHACPAFPQVLRSVLQEMRPRRVSRNRRLPCQRHIRGVLPVWGEAAVSALGSDSWPAAFRGPEKGRPGCDQAWTHGRLPRLAPRGKSLRRPGPLSAISAKAPASPFCPRAQTAWPHPESASQPRSYRAN